MPVSLGEWRVRIGTFMRRRRKEYDYNYYWRKLQNLIKKNKNAEPPPKKNSPECNISSRTSKTGPLFDVNNRANSQTRSQCDGPDCDTVKKSGSSCDVNNSGLNDVSHSESLCAESSGSAIEKETNPVPDATDVKRPVPRFCVEDELDNRHITINPMSHEYPPNSAQLSETDEPEVGTSGLYSDVSGETGRIKLHKEETPNSAPSGIEDQSSGLSLKPRLDTTRNTGQTISSLREVAECHGSPTYPVLQSGTTSGEADAIKRNECPDISNILLLRSGDVERNPGPNDTAGWSLDLEREVLSLLKDVSPVHYYELCNALDFSRAQSQVILTKNLLDVTNSLYEVICSWGVKQRDVTNYKRLLADKLRSIHLDALGTKLVEGGYSTQDTRTQCQDGAMTEKEIQRVAEEVRRHYTIDLCHFQTDPMNGELQLGFDRIFTDLTLMEEDRGTKLKTSLPYEDLLRIKVNGIYPKRLLVEGEGGVGKTTLCAKIAWDWIHGKGYQDFKLVLVILLRMAEDKTVGEIVKSYLPDDNPVTAKQLDNYILSNPKDVFLALDGLDEFAVDLKSDQQIVLITLNMKFKSGTVLITSRQGRSDVIRKKPNLRKAFAFIAVEGFSAKNLSSYIMKFFHPDTDSPKDLNRLISNNDVIRENMASYPIYTAMLCIMWREFDEDRREAMSKLQTVSQLFNEMIDFMVDHYISKHNPSAIVEGTLKKDRSDTHQHLLQIGDVAFQGLRKRRLVFEEEDFQSYPEIIDVGCKVGVLTREKKTLPRRDRRTNPNSAIDLVQFPHKLFQEYLSGMYLASLYNSKHNKYDRLMAKMISKEYQFLLYFTSAQQKEVGLDIVSRLISDDGISDDSITEGGISESGNSENGNSDDGSSDGGSGDGGSSGDGNSDDGNSDDGSIDDKFIIDVAYESQDQAVAKAVADHLSESSKTLEITEEMKAHTASGHIFIASHRKVDDLVIEKSCGRTVSEDLAEFMCSSRSLRSVRIKNTMLDVFYSVLANKAVDSKIKTLDISLEDLGERSSASHDLAQFICKMPYLKSLTLHGETDPRDGSNNALLNDDFYSTSSSIASSTRIETLKFSLEDLRERPSASRDLAQFICKMPYLKSLTLHGETGSAYGSGSVLLHDDFYSTSSSIASSAKIGTLEILCLDLSDRPSAPRDLAQFICKMPYLKDLTLNALLHDDFYSTSASIASSAKIETLRICFDDLSERPSASRDLAQFICKLSHLKNLTLHGHPRYGWQNISLHDDFYSTSSSASSAKSGNTSPLTELTVDDDILRGWQDCGSMFDNVKRVTIEVWHSINCDVIQKIHLPGATELTIQTYDLRQSADFRVQPTLLPNALLNISPQLVKVNFSDLDFGNGTVERILEDFSSTHNLKHLKSIRFIRCGTDESIGDVNIEDQTMKVEMKHGKPRGNRFLVNC